MVGLAPRLHLDCARFALGGRCAWSQRIISSLRATGRRHCDWSVRPAALGKPFVGDRLRVLRGPEGDWFGGEARARFLGSTYRVTKDADRMGVRLEGAALALVEPREMISSGVNAGVVQVPPGAQPIVLLCSRQTMGGYPRLAAVAAVDHGRLAQLKQGDEVAFTEIGLRQAHDLYLARERDFHRVRDELSRRTG